MKARFEVQGRCSRAVRFLSSTMLAHRIHLPHSHSHRPIPPCKTPSSSQAPSDTPGRTTPGNLERASGRSHSGSLTGLRCSLARALDTQRPAVDFDESENQHAIATVVVRINHHVNCCLSSHPHAARVPHHASARTRPSMNLTPALRHDAANPSAGVPKENGPCKIGKGQEGPVSKAHGLVWNQFCHLSCNLRP